MYWSMHSAVDPSPDLELSQLEALPTEVLEKQLEHLTVPGLLRAMSVSRRLSAIVLNILRNLFHAVKRKNERVKVLLTFAPPAYASSSVLCQYATTDEDSCDFTSLYSQFYPEVRRPVNADVASIQGHDILTSEAALEDGESFAQFKIIIKIILASEQYWVPHSTMIFDETIRLSREWLSSQETSELLWVDQHESVGLHILPQPKTVPERPAGIQYYDLQVTELRLRTTRFISGVEEAEYAQGNGNMVVLRRRPQWDT